MYGINELMETMIGAYIIIIVILLILFVIYEVLWIFNLVRAAQRKHWFWFVFILLFNILWIPYLIIYGFKKRKKKKDRY